MRISDIDLKTLRIFQAVVENHGFTSAQIALNVSQPTISSHIKALEERLGFRVCQRGKSGFQLTEKGEIVYAKCKVLLSAMEDFEMDMGELRRQLTGTLRFGLAENVITDKNFQIYEIVQKFTRRDQDVFFNVLLGGPDVLEKEILNGALQFAIGPFTNKLEALEYEMLYEERHSLFYGCNHPFFNLPPKQISKADILESKFVSRTYMNYQDLIHLGDIRSVAIVSSMEAQAMFILSGAFLGYLADHYAARWVDSGQLRAIDHLGLELSEPFHLVTRKGHHKSLVVRTFIEDMHAIIGN
jgi:DNA-binding transcriptional LysR family regulator